MPKDAGLGSDGARPSKAHTLNYHSVNVKRCVKLLSFYGERDRGTIYYSSQYFVFNTLFSLSGPNYTSYVVS